MIRCKVLPHPASISALAASGMICSAGPFFPRGVECPPLFLTLTESLSGGGAAFRGECHPNLLPVRHPQLVTRVGRKAPKPQERPTGRRSAPRRENRHRRGWVAFRGTTPPDAQAVPPEAHESLGSRKTVAEVPLTGLSFTFENYRSRRRC